MVELIRNAVTTVVAPFRADVYGEMEPQQGRTFYRDCPDCGVVDQQYKGRFWPEGCPLCGSETLPVNGPTRR